MTETPLKVVPLSDFARNNHQISVLELLREIVADLDARQAKGERVPNAAFVILMDEHDDGYAIEYCRSHMVPEKECYVLNQALFECLARQRQ